MYLGQSVEHLACVSEDIGRRGASRREKVAELGGGCRRRGCQKESAARMANGNGRNRRRGRAGAGGVLEAKEEEATGIRATDWRAEGREGRATSVTASCPRRRKCRPNLGPKWVGGGRKTEACPFGSTCWANFLCLRRPKRTRADEIGRPVGVAITTKLSTTELISQLACVCFFNC